MARPKIDPAAALRRDPAADIATTSGLKPRQDYTRFNVFVSEQNRPTYEDFKIYCKHIGIPISEMINQFMAETVEKHAGEIEEARTRFAKARKHYIK